MCHRRWYTSWYLSSSAQSIRCSRVITVIFVWHDLQVVRVLEHIWQGTGLCQQHRIKTRHLLVLLLVTCQYNYHHTSTWVGQGEQKSCLFYWAYSSSSFPTVACSIDTTFAFRVHTLPCTNRLVADDTLCWLFGPTSQAAPFPYRRTKRTSAKCGSSAHLSLRPP